MPPDPDVPPPGVLPPPVPELLPFEVEPEVPLSVEVPLLEVSLEASVVVLSLLVVADWDWLLLVVAAALVALYCLLLFLLVLASVLENVQELLSL